MQCACIPFLIRFAIIGGLVNPPGPDASSFTFGTAVQDAGSYALCWGWDPGLVASDYDAPVGELTVAGPLVPPSPATHAILTYFDGTRV